MRLTTKDREFLDKLRALLDDGQLAIEMKEYGIKRMILKRNYGSKIEQAFNLTRQGIRWRFQHLLGEIYVSAYETILLIESNFGTGVRHHAMAIARQRAELRAQAQKMSKIPLPRRQLAEKGPPLGPLK